MRKERAVLFVKKITICGIAVLGIAFSEGALSEDSFHRISVGVSCFESAQKNKSPASECRKGAYLMRNRPISSPPILMIPGTYPGASGPTYFLYKGDLAYALKFPAHPPLINGRPVFVARIEEPSGTTYFECVSPPAQPQCDRIDVSDAQALLKKYSLGKGVLAVDYTGTASRRALLQRIQACVPADEMDAMPESGCSSFLSSSSSGRKKAVRPPPPSAADTLIVAPDSTDSSGLTAP